MSKLLERRLAIANISASPYKLSQAQIEADGLIQSFSAQASDWKNLSAMTAGSLAYRLGKVISLASPLSRIPVIQKMLAPAFGMSAEVSAFRGTHQFLGSALHDNWLTTFTHFSALKSFGKLAQNQNIFLSHFLQDAGMVSGHHLAYGLGLATKPQGSLGEQFLHAKVSNLALGAGAALGHALTQGKFLMGEKALNLRVSAYATRTLHIKTLLPKAVMASETSYPLISLQDFHERLPEMVHTEAQRRGIDSPTDFSAALILASVSIALRNQGIRFNVSGFDANSAEIGFVNLSHIRAITGRELALPMLAFKRASEYFRFLGQMNQRPIQGLSLMAPYGVITNALNMQVQLSREMGIIIYCKEPIHGHMPPLQIRDHEATHGIDPRINRSIANPETILITEMAATIGELATPEYNHYRAITFEGFWIGYIFQYARALSARGEVIRVSPAMQRLLALPVSMTRGIYSEAELLAQARAMVVFVGEITNKFGNAELVRMLFECNTFADLENRLTAKRRPTVEIIGNGDE